MAIPPGFTMDNRNTDQVIKLHKLIYGDKRSPRLWYFHLQAALAKLHFKPSPKDSCLFVGNNVTLVVHVDDCLIVAPTQAQVDKVISDLRVEGLHLDKEDDIAGYLGVAMDGQADGTIHLRQTGLIHRVIDLVGLKDTPRTKFIPSAGPLGSNKEHGPRTDTWNYRSAIGILQYLSNNTRPDISFAVSQVSRFANDPRCTHESAVKHIVRYLRTSEDKGLIVKPSTAIPLECWCDSDFAGLFGHESHEDPRSAKSRTGFIITFGGMPLIWKSKLQTETALSSCEAELLALSSGLRYLLPIAELADCYKLVSPLPATIQVC
jgi:Reverse transcriptase (RNA-dependent DNA polymerase)